MFQCTETFANNHFSAPYYVCYLLNSAVESGFLKTPMGKCHMNTQHTTLLNSEHPLQNQLNYGVEYHWWISNNDGTSVIKD